MSTYRKIHGRSIQAVTTDPTGDITEGQVWYNTTSDTFKTVLVTESFTSVSALSTARDALQVGNVGTQTAGIAFGGRTSPPETEKNETEEYNGSGWSESGNLNDARFSGAGFGTQTAAVMAGGNRPGESPDGRSDVEEYNGSSWTNATDIPAGRYGAMGAGTLTAGIVAGGATGTYPFTAQSTSFEYDGTNWTSGGTMNKGRWIGASGGPQTAALFFGGSDTTSSPNTTNTESYDGTSFTALSALPTATRSNMGSGDTSSAVSYGGGNPSAVTTAFTWDGSSWSTSPATLGTARDEGSSSGTGTAAVTGGGSPPDAGLTISEEYNKSVNTITAAAWASASNFPAPASAVRGFGTVHSASIAIGGETGAGPTVNSCYSYDGSGWTSVPAIPSTARNAFGYGTQTAGLYSGGNTAPGQNPVTNASAEWDGSGWTSGPTMDTARGFGASSGVQTSALATGGDNGSSPLGVSNVESYNGSSWTAETAYPTGAYGVTGCGRSETTAFVFGGEAPYPGGNSNVATYNGSAWTTTATPVGTLLPANTQQASSYGEQDNCIAFGGSSSQSATAGWNGTAWSTRPSMGTGRSAGGTGISTDALAFCGSPVPAGGNKTEEFIGETSALNVKTLTQS